MKNSDSGKNDHDRADEGAGQAAAVRHNAAESRYELVLDGSLAVAAYLTRTDGARVLTHTYVPEALRGRGVAERLARAALADARAEGRKVVPECSYMARFIQRHAAEFGDLV